MKKLAEYLSELSEEKRKILLGNALQDPLHSAFSNKRVVHAGLVGEPIAGILIKTTI